jgi:site-specific DNA recombinase
MYPKKTALVEVITDIFAVVGVRQEIAEDEATVIYRMFVMRSEGSSLSRISKTLQSEGIPAPRPRRGGIRAWSPNAIHSMLRNDRYRGRIVWNRTRKVRNPETTRKQRKRRPEQEWVAVEVPELRIVPEDLWATSVFHSLARSFVSWLYMSQVTK